MRRTGHPCRDCVSGDSCRAMHPDGGTMEGHDCALFHEESPRVRGTVSVVNVRRRRAEWARKDGFRYVGRPSPLGNPFPIGKRYGNREAVIALYRKWLEDRLALKDDPGVLSTMADFVRIARGGMNLYLGCWCAPQPCHADVIAEVVRRLAHGEA